MKICTKCKELLELEAFNFKSKKKNTRQAVCRECLKPYKIGYYQDNKEAHFARNRAMSHKLREFLKRFKRICKCSVCGENRHWVLDFHHCNGEDKLREVAHMYKYGSIDSLKKEIRKCKVLCANCHRDLHYQEKQL